MSDKYTSERLKQMQSMPLEAKIIMSQRRIKQWYDHFRGNVYLSFSGGKDSTVLKHLIENTVGVYDVPSVFVDTGLEYPEIRQFAMSQPNVTAVKPKMIFPEVVRKFGYPVITKDIADCIRYARTGSQMRMERLMGEARNSDGSLSPFNCPNWKFMLDADFEVGSECCAVMKKRPLQSYEKKTGRRPYVAIMACESHRRTFAWMHSGCNAFDAKKPKSSPMAFWTEQDVLQYIKQCNVPYCSVYGDIVEDENGQLTTTGCKRTGCVFCGFGCHLDTKHGRYNKFQLLKKSHPKLYEYCINGGEYVDGTWVPSKAGLGMGHVFDYMGVPYGDTSTLFDDNE